MSTLIGLVPEICKFYISEGMLEPGDIKCIEAAKNRCKYCNDLLQNLPNSISWRLKQTVAQRTGGGPPWRQSEGTRKIAVLGDISHLTTFGSGSLPRAPIAHYFSAETMLMRSTMHDAYWLTYLLSEATERENKILRNCYEVCRNYHKFSRPICVNRDPNNVQLHYCLISRSGIEHF